MVKKEILASLIDSKKFAILKVLLNSSEELYLKEISERSKVPLATTHRILQDLSKVNILQRRVWKTSKVYSCPENEKTKFLKDLFREEVDAVQLFVSQVKDFQGIQQIILHGEQRQGKANLLLIGEYINSNRIQEVCDEINKQGFQLSFLTLAPSQYEQMSKMGLYSGTKNVLK